ncbi:hypothetical protein FIBSPDRAFT_962690 [Athelia psychrophila]|uniref:DUF6532 domain-containing protein n=1 Tax=Athelia psychrophila TaxID=1759441 RepID=A0A165ZTJ0_9AGAM|nr:hypothetical protein FIBSPDRAFT_962690 [Fibularhizoctonia sp. CBS 109695]
MSDLDFPNSSDEEDPPPERSQKKKHTKTRDNPDPTLILKASEATQRGVASSKRGSAEKENGEKENAKLKKQLKALQKMLVAEKSKPSQNLSTHSESGPESEDSDEDESVMTSFPNAMRSLGTTSASPARPLTLRLANPSKSKSNRGHNRDSSSAPGTRTSCPNNRQPSTPERRSRSPTRSTQKRPAPSSSPGPATSEAEPPHKKMLKWKNGVAPMSSRPKAGDYDAAGYSIIICSSKEFMIHVATKDLYPELDVQLEWCTSIFEEQCRKLGSEYEYIDRISGLIRARCSNTRSILLGHVRPKITSTYGFIISEKSKTIKKNKQRYGMLVEDGVFHHKDPEERKGFAQHKIVSNILHVAYFANKNDDGVKFSNYFKPISLVTLAAIFTVVEFCLDEWSTGTFEQAIFNEKAGCECYKGHLESLKKWEAGNPSVIANIRMKLFNRALRSAGGAAALQEAGVTNEAIQRAHQELEGRTGETDSEMEDGENELE